MCRVTRHYTRKHRISTGDPEAAAKLGIHWHDIRHYVHSSLRALRYLAAAALTHGQQLPHRPLSRRTIG